MSKRGREEEESSDDDMGPMPVQQTVKKKRKVLPHEKSFLDHLPSSDQYHKSFMHRDVINSVTVTKSDFVITTSTDGHLKFWKKQEQGIEFVKHYFAHLHPIVSTAASADGTLFASMADDGTLKVFDVINFDMINMIDLGYSPGVCCWVHKRGQAQSLLAVSSKTGGTIRIYDGRGDKTPLHEIEKLHKAPVHIIQYAERYNTVVSADTSGFLEYWSPSEPWDVPTIPGLWSFKSSTDLYEFKKAKTLPTSLTFSPDQSQFVTISSTGDRNVRIFNFLTGKVVRKYDESLTAVQEMQQAGTSVHRVEDMEFGRRLAVEKEVEADAKAASTMNAIWDESGNFIIYPTLLGIKIVNTVTNRVSRILGKDESSRWLHLSLYQGAPSKKGVTTVAMAASENPLLAERAQRDPVLFCTAYKRNRFYLFTKEEPESGDRDVFNERPTREEQTIAAVQPNNKNQPSRHAKLAIVHTTMGDIHIRLFPEQAPKAVENFVGHARSGYFEGVIFHRVIAKFMIQTGDPLGDGTGGESIWGHDFEDEFHPSLKHDRPYTVSMANPGSANRNASQWFITTTATSWLDGKHTIFGRAVQGLEVVHDIENVAVDKTDKPEEEDIKIINVTIVE